MNQPPPWVLVLVGLGLGYWWTVRHYRDARPVVMAPLPFPSVHEVIAVPLAAGATPLLRAARRCQCEGGGQAGSCCASEGGSIRFS